MMLVRIIRLVIVLFTIKKNYFLSMISPYNINFDWLRHNVAILTGDIISKWPD